MLTEAKEEVIDGISNEVTKARVAMMERRVLEDLKSSVLKVPTPFLWLHHLLRQFLCRKPRIAMLILFTILEQWGSPQCARYQMDWSQRK
jgi:histidinol phosphatase-like enzyme